MKSIIQFLLSIIVSILPFCGLSQHYEKEDQITFSYGSRNPIKIEVETNNEKYVFKAINSSNYPYALDVEFKQIQNLLPYATKETFVAYPGVTRLLEFTKKDPNQPHHYSYSYTVKIGDPSKKNDENFPYLLPLSTNKTIEVDKIQIDESRILITNNLKVHKGDSVFCIRKGYIAAIGNSEIRENVIKLGSSLEVRHIDGTVAVYNGIEKSSMPVSFGQTIYAGQFLGIVDNNENISVLLYSIKGDGYLRGMAIKYFNGDDSLKTTDKLDGQYVVKSELIVERELSRREKKLRSKGKLF